MKQHLWVVGIDADDSYIAQTTLAVQDYLENICDLMVTERNATLTIARFPAYYHNVQYTIPAMVGLMLPVYPVSSITQIDYVDASGNAGTLPGASLQFRNSKPPVVYPAPGSFWPFTNFQRIASVEIQMVAGYNTTTNKAGNDVKHLTKLLVAHWYKNREIATQALLQQMPFGLEELVRLQKWWW